ncbi:MAG: dihydrolipoyl dehydrogenase [Candidatus Eremiobacteraeota bacterium]|nr:dihydrolipoyl dehydrogenase [Candidatus Eremiobacteraeota bacterium]
MKSARHYDLCVLGAGSAGYSAAVRAQELGKSVVLVDGTGPLSGLCILRGCMPGKTILHSADVARTVRHAEEKGVEVSGFSVNSAKVVQRKRALVEEFAQSRVEELQAFPMLRGAARFTAAHELRVDAATIQADKFLIATGSVINIPAVPGLCEAGFLDSDTLMDVERLPQSVIILGGGAVCAEMSHYLQQSGVEVTILQRSVTLLSSEDPDIGECLRQVFEREGMRVETGVEFERVERTANGKRVLARVGGQWRVFEAEELFAALGRRANVDGFGLEAAGVEFNADGVRINEYLQTSNPDIFAAGDVTGIWRLLHVAVYEGKLAAQNAFITPLEPARYDLHRARAIFSSPQVGIAGMSERRAQAHGVWYDKASYPFKELGRAIVMDAKDGFAKMLADREGKILGITIVGAQASDMVHEAIALLYFEANVRDVLAMPHIHPTLAEILTYPAEELAGRIASRPHAELGYAAG